MSAESTATATLRMSEKQFLGRYADLKSSYEFVNGKVCQKPMTKRAHMILQDEFQAMLREYRRCCREGRSLRG